MGFILYRSHDRFVMHRNRLLALVGVVVLVLSAFGPAVAAADATTESADASYSVSALNETDDNETVDENETVNESDELNETNETEDETNETENGSDAFGLQVNAFIESLNDTNQTGPRGHLIADFVVSNNPGNAPDHAGPPAHAGPGGDDNETDDRRGPPEDKGNDGDQGPPEHAGNDEGGDDDDDEVEEETEDDEQGGGSDNENAKGR